MADYVLDGVHEGDQDEFVDEASKEESINSDTFEAVDYGSTAEELEAHFRCCGAINRVTILCDRYTGHPKGFAYIEFESEDAIEAAVALDDSNFRGRPLKVMPKRTNLPGLSSSSRFRGRMRRRFNPYGIRAGYGFLRPRTSRFRRRRIYFSAPY
ncbi:hypothetical protein AAHC03_016629 [Spirometra sp. Aus1]